MISTICTAACELSTASPLQLSLVLPVKQKACRTDQSNVLAHSPWFRFPYPGQWGPITLSWASTITMLAGEMNLAAAIKPWLVPLSPGWCR
jgi:hypothetical protein